MKWFIMTIVGGWGNVDPTTALGSVLIIITQLIAIMLAAILQVLLLQHIMLKLHGARRSTKHL